MLSCPQVCVLKILTYNSRLQLNSNHDFILLLHSRFDLIRTAAMCKNGGNPCVGNVSLTSTQQWSS